MTAGAFELRHVHAADDDLGFVASIATLGDVIVAVGGTHHAPIVLVSTNGATFHERRTPPVSGLREVIVLSRDRLLVAGESGGLFSSSDLGKSWVAIETGARACLYGLAEGLDGALWIGGDDGFVARSNDDGSSWERVLGASGRILDIAVIGDSMFLIGDGAFRWTGSAIEPMAVALSAPLTAACATPSSSLMLAGDSGQLFRSVDGGRRWNAVDSPTGCDLEDIGVVDGVLVAVGSGGTILMSDDDGRAWEAIGVGDDVHLWAIRRSRLGAFIGGDNGLVLRLAREGQDPWASAGLRDELDEPGELDAWFLDVEPDGFSVAGYVAGYLGGAEGEEGEDEDGVADDGGDEEHEHGPECEHDEGGEDIPADARAAFRLLARPGDADSFAAVWGLEFPPELAELTAALEARGAGDGFYEWSPSVDIQPNPDEGANLFEALVLRDQQAYLGTGLPEVFAGIMCLGYLGNGDTYHLQVLPSDDEAVPRPVLLFNHETHDLEAVFARNLNSLVYLSALCQARDEHRVSAKAFSAGVARLSGHVCPSWHFRSHLEKAAPSDWNDFEPTEQLARYLYYRARWLIYLFRNDGVVGVEDTASTFVPDLNSALTDEQHEKWLVGAGRWAPTALYVMWRCWFFRDPRLQDYLAIGRAHASRLARDAAALIDELAAGRARLGTIEDMHALRDLVIALDIDPARAEQRAADARAREQERAQMREAAAAQVVAALASGADLAELAFAHLDSRIHHDAIADGMRQDPTLAQTFDIIDWVECSGWVRHNLVLSHERMEACDRFAELADDRVVPLLCGAICRDDRSEPDADDDSDCDSDLPVIQAKPPGQWRQASYLLAALARHRPLDPRVVAAIRPILDIEEKYEHRRENAVWVLGAMADAGSAAAMARLATSRRLDTDYSAKIRGEDLVKAIALALGRIGGDEAAAGLIALLSEASGDYDEVWPIAAEALARAQPSGAALDAVAGAVARVEDDDKPQLIWTLARIAAAVGGQSAQRALRVVAALDPGEDSVFAIARACALARLGEAPDDLPALIDRALAEPGWDGDATIARRIWAMRAVGDCQAVPVDPALLCALRDDRRLRDEALAALERRGVDAPASRAVSRFTITGLGSDELIALMQDRSARYRYNVSLRLAELGAKSARPAIVEYCRELLAFVHGRQPLPRDLDYALRWSVKALVEIGLDDATAAFLDELLEHPSRDVKDPVLRNPPADVRLVSGMLCVQAEKWGWQESTARQWLAQFEDTDAYAEALAARRRN